jgi:hypothetical protein
MSGDYLDFDALEKDTCMSKRWWRDRLPHVPHIRLPGKIIFRRSDIDEYLQQFMKVPEPVDLRGLLDKVMPAPRRRRDKGRFRGEGAGGT